jgi:hypothetical protein
MSTWIIRSGKVRGQGWYLTGRSVTGFPQWSPLQHRAVRYLAVFKDATITIRRILQIGRVVRLSPKKEPIDPRPACVDRRCLRCGSSLKIDKNDRRGELLCTSESCRTARHIEA